MEKIKKFGDIEIQKQKLLMKTILNILLGTKMLKKAHRKDFDETKYISFLVKDDELLENYNEIWEKVKK